MTERKSLESVADDLDSFVHDLREEGNSDATALWLEMRVTALRRLAAQDQKPVAWGSAGDEMAKRWIDGKWEAAFREYCEGNNRDFSKAEIDSNFYFSWPKPDAAETNASAVLQSDLGEMLSALGMSDAAQPKSPHEVFQSAIAEMKRQIANASAEARLREALERELSGNSGQLLDIVASAIRGDGSDLCDGDWVSLSEDQKEGWRGDANRALAAIKEYLIALSQHPHASDCDKQKECCDLAAKEPCADCPFPNPDATVRGFTDLERTLLIAARAGLNYIANTESELGMTLKSGDLLRAAIAKAECYVHASDCDKQGER